MTTQTEAGGIPAAGPVERVEVLVVGGGAAGLSGALVLARARRSVLVVDAGEPRNAPAGHVQGFLTRDGVPPGELLAAARAEVAEYGVRLRTAEALGAERRPGGGFRVALADGTAVEAERLLVATGLTDELPPVPGLAARWGRDVLHCPYCHGWEVRGARLGVLSGGPLAVQQALLWRQWSAEVTLFLHEGPEPGEEEYEQLAARSVTVVDGAVTGLVTEGDGLTGVRLASGRVIPCGALAVSPRMSARTGFLSGLGLRATDLAVKGHVVGSRIAADASGATDVPGVWVAGNAAEPTAQVLAAAAAGAKAAMAVNADLVAEDTRRAVAARRTPFSPEAESAVCEAVLGERRHGL
ncbi:NAD(P)/FAD-dependent oxidoreductase [Streptomyces sp. NPDC047999]|uniref:NAD(P)/FAD-dependent oxidoreductase n=1 Tax=Streptomyces sp. NPDC047999 TaxID=3365497 RepID=UPI00371F1646